MCHGSYYYGLYNIAAYGVPFDGLGEHQWEMLNFISGRPSRVRVVPTESLMDFEIPGRVSGIGRIAAGTLAVEAGVPLLGTGLGTPVGAFLIGWGADQYATGMQEVVTNQHQRSYLPAGAHYLFGDGPLVEFGTFVYDVAPTFLAANPQSAVRGLGRLAPQSSRTALMLDHQIATFRALPATSDEVARVFSQTGRVTTVQTTPNLSYGDAVRLQAASASASRTFVPKSAPNPTNGTFNLSRSLGAGKQARPSAQSTFSNVNSHGEGILGFLEDGELGFIIQNSKGTTGKSGHQLFTEMMEALGPQNVRRIQGNWSNVTDPISSNKNLGRVNVEIFERGGTLDTGIQR
ncbi:MAG: hypothetical protein MI861_01785, partial [Pirellulales bacterium]|nr:hypothetical protein [Pirellulales bacterium]